MGVSMGSVYALASAMNDSTASHLAGLILIGSPLRVHRSQIVHFDNISCIFPLIFNRKRPFLYLDGRRLESSVNDQEYIDARRNDSLSIHYISMDYLLKVRKIQRECKRKSALSSISLPVLIIHGGNDKISSIRGAYFLSRNLVNSRKQLLIYPSSRHSVFWDTDSVTVVRDLVKWVSEQ